jgi:uncharacterized protein (DUF58 family)
VRLNQLIQEKSKARASNSEIVALMKERDELVANLKPHEDQERAQRQELHRREREERIRKWGVAN